MTEETDINYKQKMLLTICHTIVHISNLLKMISLAIQTKKEVTRDFLGIANDVAGN